MFAEILTAETLTATVTISCSNCCFFDDDNLVDIRASKDFIKKVLVTTCLPPFWNNFSFFLHFTEINFIVLVGQDY